MREGLSACAHLHGCVFVSSVHTPLLTEAEEGLVLGAQVHEKIRENPIPEEKEKKKFPSQPPRKQPKLTYDERKQRLKVGVPLCVCARACVRVCLCACEREGGRGMLLAHRSGALPCCRRDICSALQL